METTSEDWDWIAYVPPLGRRGKSPRFWRQIVLSLTCTIRVIKAGIKIDISVYVLLSLINRSISYNTTSADCSQYSVATILATVYRHLWQYRHNGHVLLSMINTSVHQVRHTLQKWLYRYKCLETPEVTVITATSGYCQSPNHLLHNTT